MLHIYYYVPPCPVCGSRRTGRYIRQPMIQADETKANYLKHGEIVEFLPEEPIENAFCTECGAVWPEHVAFKLWPAARIAEEARERGTQELYQEFLTEQYMKQSVKDGRNGKSKKKKLF